MDQETFDLIAKKAVVVRIRGIELVALKKLALVSHALARKVGGEAGREQECLAATLDGLIRQIELYPITEGVNPQSNSDTASRAQEGE